MVHNNVLGQTGIDTVTDFTGGNAQDLTHISGKEKIYMYQCQR